MKHQDLSLKQWIIGICAILVAIYFIYNPKNQDDKVREASYATNQPIPETVKEGLVAPIQDIIVAGLTVSDYDQIMKAANNGDDYVFSEKVQNGTAIHLNKGQIVKVIDTGVMKVQVRVMDGAYAGKSCYVPIEYITGNWKK
jgi:Tfp pilus assembly protein PilP